MQQYVNEKRGDRGAVVTTLKRGKSVELSNGISIIFKEYRGTDQIMLVLVAPKDVVIYRENTKHKTEEADEQTNSN
jgi:sRNA-binding carbon storage regulator CsrA